MLDILYLKLFIYLLFGDIKFHLVGYFKENAAI